jgi:hypothetical protein
MLAGTSVLVLRTKASEMTTDRRLDRATQPSVGDPRAAPAVKGSTTKRHTHTAGSSATTSTGSAHHGRRAVLRPSPRRRRGCGLRPPRRLGGQKVTLRWGGQPVPPQQADARLATPAAVLAGVEPLTAYMPELNLAGDTVREVTAGPSGASSGSGAPCTYPSRSCATAACPHGLTTRFRTSPTATVRGSFGAPWHGSTAGSHCQ